MSKTQYIYPEDPTPQEAYSAIDFMLSNASTARLIQGVMDDYTPKATNAKTGLGFWSVMRSIGFAITHPVHTYNLISFARSGGYNSPAFQERMIRNPTLQNVLSTNSEKLEQVGQILKNTEFGKELFSDTGPLSSRALTTLSKTFATKTSMDAIQKIALKAITPVSPITIKEAQYRLIANDPQIKDALAKRGITENTLSETISQKDLREIRTTLTPPDLKEMESVVAKASLSAQNKLSAAQCELFSKNPNVMSRLAKFTPPITELTPNTELSYKQLDAMKFAMQTPELTNLGYIAGGPTTTKNMGIIADVCKLWRDDPSLRQTFADNGPAIQAYLEKEATHDPIKGYLSLYGVDPTILKQVPQILTQPEIAYIVMDSFAKREPFMNTVEKFLEAAKDSEGFKAFAQANHQFLNDASIGYLNSSEDWKVWTDSIGLNSGVLNAVGAIMHDPKIAHEIIKTYNEGRGFDLADIMLETLNNPTHPLLAKLQNLARDGSYTKLVNDILASSPSMKDGLIAYGLTEEQIPQVIKITEILLDKPEELKKVYELFKKQDYVELSATLLDLTKTTPALKSYLDANTALAQTVATKALEKQATALSSYVDTSKVAEHVPEVVQSLLKAIKNPSDALIESIRTSDYTKMTGEVIELLCNKDVGLSKAIQGLAKDGVFNTLIQGMIDQNAPLKKQLANLGITAKNLPKVTKIFEILLDEPEKLRDVFNQFKTKDYLGLAKTVLKLASENEKVSYYLYENKQIIENVIQDTLQKNSEIKYWTQGTDLSKTTKALVQTLAVNPERMIDMIDQYKTGAWGALATNLLMTIDVRDTAVAATAALQKRGGFWGAVAGATQYAASWVCTDTAKIERQTAAKQLFDELSSHQKSSVENEYKILDGINISNPKGVALQLNNTEFTNVTIVNSIIQNVNFTKATFSNCSFLGTTIDSKTRFDGATIDAATLRSLADSRTNNGKPIRLDNVKIVGDISDIDLTRIALQNADFTAVTAANNIKGVEREALQNINQAVASHKPKTVEIEESPPTRPHSPNTSFERSDTEPFIVAPANKMEDSLQEPHILAVKKVKQNVEQFLVEGATSSKPTRKTPSTTEIIR